MARRLSRALFATAKQSVFSVISRSNTTAASFALIPNSSFFLHIRPIVATASYYGRLSPSLSTRGFATGQTSSSLSDPNPNWSNQYPQETTILEGCGSEHWLVFMVKPKAVLIPTDDETVDSYIKTLAMVVGSDEEARMKIYYVSTRYYFGAFVTEEVAHKIDELPTVRWVIPDVHVDMRIKVFGGEPLINNASEYERNWRNDRPQPGSNMGAQPNPPPNPPGASNMGAQQSYAPNNPDTYPPRGPSNNAPNYHYGPRPNNGGAPPPYQPGPNNFSQDWGCGPGQNSGNYATNAWPNWNGFGPNMGHGPSQNNALNYHYGPGPNNGGAPPPYQPGPNNISQDWGFRPGQNSGNYATNPWPNWSGFGPNMGHNQY